jgi:hypothetical protein
VFVDSYPTFPQILRRRELWGASLGHFASNYGYYFIVSWLPFYLTKSRGFSMGSMVAIASWAYLLNALSALAMMPLYTVVGLRPARIQRSASQPMASALKAFSK